jgi:hypothetical protein
VAVAAAFPEDALDPLMAVPVTLKSRVSIA